MLQSVTKYIYSSTILTYRFEAADYFHFLLLHITFVFGIFILMESFYCIA